MDFNIVALETQNNGKDWPLIVGAVKCPECNADIGEKCVSIGRTNEFLINQNERNDWHQRRKLVAAAAWYQHLADEQVSKDRATNGEKEKSSAAASSEPPKSDDGTGS